MESCRLRGGSRGRSSRVVSTTLWRRGWVGQSEFKGSLGGGPGRWWTRQEGRDRSGVLRVSSVAPGGAGDARAAREPGAQSRSSELRVARRGRPVVRLTLRTAASARGGSVWIITRPARLENASADTRLSRFGAEKGHKAGPDSATTTVGEAVRLKLQAGGAKVRPSSVSRTNADTDSEIPPCRRRKLSMRTQR